MLSLKNEMAINKITDLVFRRLKPGDTEQLVSDGSGLFVRLRHQRRMAERYPFATPTALKESSAGLP
jgi:hypothetical protein